MPLNAAQLLTQLQQQIQLNQDRARPMAGIPESAYGPRSLEAAESLGFLGGNMFGRATGQVRLQQAAALDEMDRQAAAQQAQFQEQKPGLMGLTQRELIAQGIDPAEGARIGRAMYGAETPQQMTDALQMAEQSINDPRFNPAIAQANAAAQQKAQGEALKLEQELLAANQTAMQPLMQGRRSLNNTRDLMTLVGNEGSFRTPGQARGAYRTMRGKALNDLRTLFEAGALQQAELEFFQTLLPEFEDWVQLSGSERMAQLKELEYTYETALRDAITLSGRDIDFDQFVGRGRTIDEIMTPGLPDGFEATDSLGGTGTTATDIVTAPGALGGAQGTLPQIPPLSEWGVGR